MESSVRDSGGGVTEFLWAAAIDGCHASEGTGPPASFTAACAGQDWGGLSGAGGDEDDPFAADWAPWRRSAAD